MNIFFTPTGKRFVLAFATMLISLLQINHASAQISIRDTITVSYRSTAVSSFSINKPALTQQGDILIANITDFVNATHVAASSSGWSEISTASIGDGQGQATILYKIAGANEPSSYTFEITSNSTAYAAGIVVFSGVNTVDPINFTGTFRSAVPTSNVLGSIPSITTTQANTAVLLFACASRIPTSISSNQVTSYSVATDPSSLSEIFDRGNTLNNNNGCSVGASWAIKPTAGATGNGSITFSWSGGNTTRTQAGILLALNPKLSFSVTSGSTSHGSSCVGTAATKITYTITNNTSSAVTGLSVSSNSAEFAVSNAPSSLTANGTATYDITFTPTSAGARTATIKIKSTSPLDSINSSLTGTGDQPTVTFTSSPSASTLYNQDVTYTTEASQTNYVWTVPGTVNVDYSITSGGIGSTSNTVVLKWLTTGSKTVTVNYTNSNGCTASSAASSQTIVTLGTNRYAIATGNWGTTNTWSSSSGGASGASVPTQYDTVYIGEASTNRTVTILSGFSANAGKIVMGNLATSIVGGINFTDNTSSLTVNGDVTVNRPSGNATSTIAIGAGSMTVNGNLRLANYTASATNNGRINKITISTGTLTLLGNLVLGAEDAGGLQSQIVFSAAGTLNIGGTFNILNNLGVLTPSTGTVNFNSSTVSQSIPIGVSAVTYNNLTINNTYSTGASISAAITSSNVTGNLSVQTGGLSNGGYAITLASGKSLSVSNGATLYLSGTSTMPTISGVGTKTFGATSTLNYSGTAQTVTAETYGHLTLSGSGTKTMPSSNTTVAGNLTTEGSIAATALDTINVSGNVTIGSGTTFSAGTFTHAVGGNWINNGTFNASTGTINFNGTSTISGSSTTAFKNLSIASTKTLTASANTVNISGDFTSNGTFNHNDGTVVFTGSDNQALRGATQVNFKNFKLAKPGVANYSTVNLDTLVTISGLMTFETGLINPTNAVLLELTSTATVTGAQNNSFVNGKMKKTGFASSFTFPVGYKDGSSRVFNPVTIDVSGGGASDSYIAGYNHGKSDTDTLKKNNNVPELTEVPRRGTWLLQRTSGSDNSLAITIHSGTGYDKDDSTFSLLGFDAMGRLFNDGWGKAVSGFPTLTTNGTTQTLRVSGIYLGTASGAYNKRTTGSSLSTGMNNIITANESNGSLSGSPSGSVEVGGSSSNSSNNTLPVELISFTARATPEKKVALNWATATESVNKGFRIERQTVDLGNKFENIGFVNTKAIGGNSQSNLYYNFLDNTPKPSAANHYRLVQEDLDGKLTYSEVRMVRLGTQSVSMVFPNPSAGNVTISRTSDDKKMNIQIIDLSGKVVKEYNNISESYYKFNITQPGVYTIKMTYPETGEQSVQRVVVQR